jgi:hypothetical protein
MRKPAKSIPKPTETEFEQMVKLSGGPPTKRFTKKDERMLLRIVHEDRKKNRRA